MWGGHNYASMADVIVRKMMIIIIIIADQRVLRWFGHVERIDENRSQWGSGTRETEVRLDGWCEGGHSP